MHVMSVNIHILLSGGEHPALPWRACDAIDLHKPAGLPLLEGALLSAVAHVCALWVEVNHNLAYGSKDHGPLAPLPQHLGH